MGYVIVTLVSLVAGGALSFLYANSVIRKYETAAAQVDVAFNKVAGKVVAVKKAL